MPPRKAQWKTPTVETVATRLGGAAQGEITGLLAEIEDAVTRIYDAVGFLGEDLAGVLSGDLFEEVSREPSSSSASTTIGARLLLLRGHLEAIENGVCNIRTRIAI